MLLEYSRSYLYILIAYGVIFLFAMTLGVIGYFNYAFPIIVTTMTMLFAFLLISQLRSGIALDSWWIAKYRRGTWQYTGLIAWNCFGLILSIVFSAVSLSKMFSTS